MSPAKAIHVRLAATLAVVVMFAIVVPISAGASDAGMKQSRRYQSASSVSAFTPGAGFVGFESDGSGFWGARVGEPVSFRVPQGARSVRVAIVDDAFQVRAFVHGDVADRFKRHPVCSTPRKVGLARGAKVLQVSPDAGFYPFFETGFAGNGDKESCFSPLSLPTRGTITVLFSRSA